MCSLLKIWNRNLYGGVVAAFNCQGAGWCKLEKQYLIHDPDPDKITGGLCANDVEQLAKVAPTDWEGDCVIYSHRGGELVQLHRSAMLPLTLQKLEYEVFTVAPLKVRNSLFQLIFFSDFVHVITRKKVGYMSHCHVKDWFFVHPGDVVYLESGMC